MSQFNATVTGAQAIVDGLQAKIVAAGVGIERGLKVCGVLLQHESQKLVPVDLGPLRASAFTRSSGNGMGTEVRVGYTAAYAVIVHEVLEAAHGEEYNQKYAAEIASGAQYWYKGAWRTYHRRRPQEQAKFLEQPLRDLQNDGRFAKILRDSVYQEMKK